MKFANALMSLILRSPLHRLLSGNTMLITFTGRKSGRRYTTPVSYARDGDTLTVTSRRGRRWWRNLEGGAPVTVRLRGREIEGTADVESHDEEAIARAFAAYYERLRPGRSSPEAAAAAARDRVIITVRLAG